MKNRTLKLILVLVSIPYIAACNRGMKAAIGDSDSANATNPSLDLNAALADIDAVPLNNSSFPRVSFQSNLDADFGDVAKVFDLGESIMNKALWPVVSCDRVGTSLDLRAKNKQYRCGELPVGKILDNNRKEAFVFDFEGLSGKSNGVKYKVEEATIPLILSRHQKSARAQLLKLDTNRDEQIDIEQGITDSIYYRLSPENGTLRSDVCFFSPGLQINSLDQKLTVRAEKKVFIFKLKGKADIHVRPGNISFSSAKVCSSFRSSIINAAGKFKPTFKFEKIAAPHFKDLKIEGLDVNVKVRLSGILKIISGVLKIVGINLEKKIQKKVEASIRSQTKDALATITTKDVNTGQWLEKYVNSELFKGKIVNELEKRTGSSMDTQGPGTEADLSSTIEAACETMADIYPDRLERQFEVLCKNSFVLKLQFFLDNPSDRQKGCYDGFFAAKDREQKPWWTNQCKIRNSLEVVVPNALAPFYNCIMEVVKKPSMLLQPGTCLQELEIADQHLSSHDIQRLLEQARVISKQRDAIKGYRQKIEDKYKQFIQRL